MDHGKDSLLFREPGCRRKTNASYDSAIIKTATSSSTTSVESVRRRLQPSRHLVVSKEKIREQQAIIISCRRPLRRLPLTPPYKEASFLFLLTSCELKCDRREAVISREEF
ncbi:HTH_Tnp_Tc3_2 domain-containing protein [Trichonephila clavipes]|nr:HTH_Tnp_Tc3_2 domain-containing protein [Trichonephila clavipes]